MALTVSPQTDFMGLVITPALAPEIVTHETAGKETGDIRNAGGQILLSLGPQKKLSLEALRKAGGISGNAGVATMGEGALR